MKARDFNAWASRFMWPFNLPKSCPVTAMDPGSENCEAWIREFQQQHGLLVDGRLGPSTLSACAALFDQGGMGLGPAIIGGQSVELGIPVARMGTIERYASALSSPPALATFLSIAELERQARHRRVGERPIRSHFTIDSARGAQGHSLILQWADPLMQVPFAPLDFDGDYPRGLQAVGIELENPLVPHERAGDQRRWLRERPLVAATINGQRCRQLAFHPEQLAALRRLMAALEQHLHIPLRFPVAEYAYSTQRAEQWSQWTGYLARFHYADRLHEPGAGLVEALGALFGELEQPEQAAAELGVPAKLASLPPPIQEAQAGEREAAWSGPTPSGLSPRADAGAAFSMAQFMGGRRRGSRNRQSRAEALAKRLLSAPD